ncbi:hypothetical protein [Paracoccus sphaerophysae]|uniref:hypothetical protein n=1 Tax=Paracoccus sphaerophysae TaxID=690417 RepID=UPI002358ED90|nr:hypothetical protein [Paracoccus sphaerophysae]
MDTSVIFVVDPPHLILESIMLVGSVRRHLPDVDLQAYCPASKRGAIPSQLVQFFKWHGVTLNYIKTEDVFSPDYPQGNKLLACRATRKTARTLFLDTDVVLAKPFDIQGLIQHGQISASPEGRRTWGKIKFGQDWSYLYSRFDLPMPTDTVQLVRTNASSPPYFNAGVVGYVNKSRSRDTAFGRCWLDTALTFDADKTIVSPRPWLDQIALPVAAARQRLSFKVLSQDWNLSLSRPDINDVEELNRMNGSDPFIVHYHRFGFFEGTRYAEILDETTRAFTVFESFSELSQPYADISGELNAIERQMHDLRSRDKAQRTGQDRLRLAELKTQRLAVINRPLSEKLAKWPKSIVA